MPNDSIGCLARRVGKIASMSIDEHLLCRRFCPRVQIESRLRGHRARAVEMNNRVVERARCPPYLPPSLAQAIRPFRKHLYAIESLTRREVERLLVGSTEGHIGGLAAGLDGAEIFALGVEHLNACDGGYVQPAVPIDREAVGSAFGAGRDIAKLQ